MFAKDDASLLCRSLEHNRVVLFLGAGFSRAATNRLDAPLPFGGELAEYLWEWCAFDVPYDGAPLASVYQAALDLHRPMRELRFFLENHLLTTDVPDWYHRFARIFWKRIYTTNVDDVVERSYSDSQVATSLTAVSALQQDYSDRDQFLDSIQYIKLNGSLPGNPTDITFSTRQYAERIAKHDTWYSHFARDYIWHPTVFIGTELLEPTFWKALEERQQRGYNPEKRPRSFLIAPAISPVHLPTLKSMNVHHVQGSAE